MVHKNPNFAQKERIFQAAEEHFLSKGYEATRLEDIVRDASVSKSAIYNLFGGKRELFIAMNNVMVTRAISDLTLSIPAIDTSSSVTIKQDLIDFAKSYLKILLSEQSGKLFKLNLSVCDQFKTEPMKYFIPCSDEFVDLLSKYFNSINNADILKIPDAEIAAQQFSSLIRGSIMCHAMFDLDDKYDENYKSQYVEKSVELFIRGHQQQ